MLDILRSDSLNSALKDIDQYNIYAALDILNKHLKKFIEELKPGIDTTLQKLEEYYATLHEAKTLLENSSDRDPKEQARLVAEAKEKIEQTITKLSEIDSSFSMMSKELGCLK